MTTAIINYLTISSVSPNIVADICRERQFGLDVERMAAAEPMILSRNIFELAA